MNESPSAIEGSWAKEDYIVKVQGLGMLKFPYLTVLKSVMATRAEVIL